MCPLCFWAFGGEIGQAPKRGGPDRGAELTPYENLLVFYARFQERYSWTVRDIDEAEMELLLDQLAAVSIVDTPPVKTLSIEDVT